MTISLALYLVVQKTAAVKASPAEAVIVRATPAFGTLVSFRKPAPAPEPMITPPRLQILHPISLTTLEEEAPEMIIKNADYNPELS